MEIIRGIIITEVDSDGQRIVKVKVTALSPKGSVVAVITRPEVVQLIRAAPGYKLYTKGIFNPITRTYPLTDVIECPLGFIKTKGNEDKFDNLGELPGITHTQGEQLLSHSELVQWLQQYYQ